MPEPYAPHSKGGGCSLRGTAWSGKAGGICTVVQDLKWKRNSVEGG